MRSCHLSQTNRPYICRSTGQCISSWWMSCCTKPSSPLIRSMHPGPQMKKSSSESTGVFVCFCACAFVCMDLSQSIVQARLCHCCCVQVFRWWCKSFRNYSLTGWLVNKWACIPLIDSHWTDSWEGKTCLVNRSTDKVSRLRAPKMSVCARLSFRVDISDTLMYVYEMLGSELLSNLYDKLGRLLTNAEQPTSWQVGET